MCVLDSRPYGEICSTPCARGVELAIIGCCRSPPTTVGVTCSSPAFSATRTAFAERVSTSARYLLTCKMHLFSAATMVLRTLKWICGLLSDIPVFMATCRGACSPMWDGPTACF